MTGPRNDTTTSLNAGVGGDVMDESLVTQFDGTTQAKRPRVVPGGDDGSLQAFDHDGLQNRAAVVDRQAVILLREILLEMRRHTALLHYLTAQFESGLTRDDVDDLLEGL